MEGCGYSAHAQPTTEPALPTPSRAIPAENPERYCEAPWKPRKFAGNRGKSRKIAGSRGKSREVAGNRGISIFGQKVAGVAIFVTAGGRLHRYICIYIKKGASQFLYGFSSNAAGWARPSPVRQRSGRGLCGRPPPLARPAGPAEGWLYTYTMYIFRK